MAPPAKPTAPIITRAKALKRLAAGADPADKLFTDHQNYHVRRYAWEKQGRPLPDDQTARDKLFENLHIKPGTFD